jgi:predicted flap endonuclease-1-like 5' DNA nuclease
VWVIIALVLLILLVWWWSRRAEAPEPAARMEQLDPDDLKRIEGIGPKISGLLQAAGIETFAKLASTDAAHLLQIVRDAGITIADPTTWPEQAALAAKGEWEQLETLQDALKGGRRE